MANPIVDSPFKDAQGPDAVPTRGSGKGSYDAQTVPDTPSRQGGMYPELTFDTTFSTPKASGPISNSPFNDVVGKK